MKKIVRLFLVFIFVGVQAFAQNEGTLSFMNSLPQVTYNNPAFVPRYRVSVGLPGSSIMAYYSNNSFTYNDAVTHVHDSVKADLTKFNNALRPKNYITTAIQADLFRLSLKINARLYLTFNETVKTYERLMFPKNLTTAFIGGTAAFIGKSVSLSPNAEAVAYLESALGASYAIDKNLTVGARIKLLKGFANATTQSATLNLAVDNLNYGLTANAGADIRTSGIYNFTQSGYDFGKNYKDYLHNNGFAFDIGATYRLMDRLTLGASLIDIGSINWKNNTYGYTLNQNSANYTFQGVDLSQVINGNTNYLNAQGDSIQKKFTFKEGAISAYRSPIPGKMYLSGMYEIRRNFKAGAVLYAEKFRGRFTPGLTIGVTKDFGRRLTASGTYTIANNSYNNLGLGFSLNLPPFQLYLVGDNLLRIPLGGSDLNKFINSTQVFNVRTGLNFVFGWDKKQEKQDPSVSCPQYYRKQKPTHTAAKHRNK
ncbi:MAG: hypothetical protein JSS79_12390 [Bacteroidetes bacterium]|nr:hypothetical protein [Bacteroidota bacterium]